MKKKILTLAVALAAAALVYAQSVLPVGITVAAVSTDVPILVRYVGSNSSATVAVDAATGDLTFQVGGVAYSGFECPISGGLGGVIDVSDAACNTFEEVVDTINGNCTGCSSDFRAVLLDSLGSDSSINTLITLGTTQVTTTDGVGLLNDGTTAFYASRALLPPELRKIGPYLTGPPYYRLVENPYRGRQAWVRYMDATTTYGSGTSNFKVYSVKARNGTNTTETVTTLSTLAGGATTVFGAITNFVNNPLPGRPDEKVIVRIENSAAMTAAVFNATGELRPTNTP